MCNENVQKWNIFLRDFVVSSKRTKCHCSVQSTHRHKLTKWCVQLNLADITSYFQFLNSKEAIWTDSRRRHQHCGVRYMLHCDCLWYIYACRICFVYAHEKRVDKISSQMHLQRTQTVREYRTYSSVQLFHTNWSAFGIYF